MPNAIKYSVSSETLALKKGNFYIGTGDVGKGPTSSTGYYNGVTPPAGGYTVYLNKESGGPVLYANGLVVAMYYKYVEHIKFILFELIRWIYWRIKTVQYLFVSHRYYLLRCLFLNYLLLPPHLTSNIWCLLTM